MFGYTNMFFECSKLIIRTMPEGDTVFRTAQTLQKYMAGHVVTRFESVYPALTRIAEDHPIVGRTIEAVSARGKHLLMTFSGDLVLRTHLQDERQLAHLSGRRAGGSARRGTCACSSARQAACAVGFNIPVAELLSTRELERHRQLQSLGPDLLGEPFDRSEVVRRMRARGGDPIAEVLLDQRVVAGHRERLQVRDPVPGGTRSLHAGRPP